jgi:glyoxylase-like metal-dependent hydrolase (beta-lactamase superfamily II)
MAPPSAVAVAPGVFRIPTVGSWAVNSFALLDDDGSVTLVDTGLDRAPARIVAGLAALGKHPADVQRIVLTHAHPDHAGGAKEMADRTGAPVAVHAEDAGFVESGESPPHDRSSTAARIFARLQDGRFPAVRVGEKLTDGQVLDVAGGLRVVATPGHSPGHISLLHEPTRTLITGDAIFNVLGLRYSPRVFCSDFRLSRRTAHVLGELEYERAGFTHGPEIVDGAREAVRRFLAKAVTLRAPE